MALRRISRLLIILLFPSLTAFGQASDQSGDEKRSYGKLTGEWRTFYMATVNKDSLKDFQALATGGYLKYAYHIRNRVELAAAVYTSLNLNIQDITEPDPVTGRVSRYEAGLFDINDLDDRSIFILGELYASYKFKQGFIRAGRMRMKTPFVNGQDGRMIPTMIQGIQLYHKPLSSLDYTIGWYNGITPRSTGGYFRIGESIGQYPEGRNPDGTPSGYKDNTDSDFMLIADINWKPIEQFRLRMVDYYIENVFHTLYLNPAYTWHADDRSITLQGEWVLQNRIGDGGNTDESLRYFTDKSANVLGLQLSTQRKTAWRIAYNRIADDGRFLFPREWGREFLFTFQKRERSEGMRDSHGLLIGMNHPLPFGEDILQLELTAGRHWVRPVSDAEANKYALPDYTHVNIDLAYTSKKLKAFRPEFLVTWKSADDRLTENPNVVLNKVDMWHFSLVLNYRIE